MQTSAPPPAGRKRLAHIGPFIQIAVWMLIFPDRKSGDNRAAEEQNVMTRANNLFFPTAQGGEGYQYAVREDGRLTVIGSEESIYIVDPRPGIQTCECKYKRGVATRENDGSLRIVEPAHHTCKHLLGVQKQLLRQGVFRVDQTPAEALRDYDRWAYDQLNPPPAVEQAAPVGEPAVSDLVAQLLRAA